GNIYRCNGLAGQIDNSYFKRGLGVVRSRPDTLFRIIQVLSNIADQRLTVPDIVTEHQTAGKRTFLEVEKITVIKIHTAVFNTEYAGRAAGLRIPGSIGAGRNGIDIAVFGFHNTGLGSVHAYGSSAA